MVNSRYVTFDLVSLLLLHFLCALVSLSDARRSSSSYIQISSSCESALRKCSKQMPCGMALHDYRLSCKQVLYGQNKNCTELCQLAIVSLLSTPEGAQYLNCDCGTNEYCKQIRLRTSNCNAKNGGISSVISQLPANHPLVQQQLLSSNNSNSGSQYSLHYNHSNSFYKNSLNNNIILPSTSSNGLSSQISHSNSQSNSLSTSSSSLSSSSSSSASLPSSSSSNSNQGFIPVFNFPKLSKSRYQNKSHSCRSVELFCRSDAHCSSVYDYYRTNCVEALQGDRCSSRCNNSLTLLWKQRNGHNFRYCYCDKSGLSSSSSSVNRCRRQRTNLMRTCFSIGSSSSVSHPNLFIQIMLTIFFVSIVI